MSDRVDYDIVARDYARRYERNNYYGVERALAAFIATGSPAGQARVLEVGCGTGHWVQFLRDAGIDVVGLDPSAGMLDVARTIVPGRLIRAAAEALPCLSSSFERVFCVNALHHFTDAAAFFRDARRVLRKGGALLTIGLDPHSTLDRWWIYEYFPGARSADLRRYLPVHRIRELMDRAGFSACETREVQHIPARFTVSEADRRGFLERTSASQLMVISEAEYETGMKRIRAAANSGEAILVSDLRVHGTIGWAA